jgi:formylglycine-generating enzyme required for sulfatase activity
MDILNRDLRQQISEAFSQEELGILCHDLGFDYDELPADRGKSGKVVELIRVFHRQNRLSELIAALHTERPNISWPDPASLPPLSGLLGDSSLPELPFELETVEILAGEFTMGTAPGANVPAYESPLHKVDLPAFLIGKYPVKNEQYEVFVKETGHPAPRHNWVGQSPDNGKEDHPVVGISWYDAAAFCEWLSDENIRFRLPSEAEWEKAARGADGRLFPWGNEWQADRCNCLDEAQCDEGTDVTTPVGQFPEQGPYGCFDMVGNVREWTNTLWGMQSTNESDYSLEWKNDEREHFRPRQLYCGYRIHRGGAACDGQNEMRCSARGWHAPDIRHNPRIGFRLVQEL